MPSDISYITYISLVIVNPIFLLVNLDKINFLCITQIDTPHRFLNISYCLVAFESFSFLLQFGPLNASYYLYQINYVEVFSGRRMIV